MSHIRFGEESRYPGFRCRMDDNFIDEENRNCSVNSVYDKKTKTWACFKRVRVDRLTRASCSDNEANRA
jgi:adenylylsulfate reductase, subunit A